MERAIFFVGTALLVAACPTARRPEPDHASLTMPHPECRHALEAFARAEPNLAVLPVGCRIEDVASVMHSAGAISRGELGEPVDVLDVHYFESPSLSNITAWVRDQGDVVLLDAVAPPTTREAYIRALGEPELRLDFEWRYSTLQNGELVWLSRGVVVDATDTQTNNVLRVGIFTPCSREQYQRLRFSGKLTDER